MNWSISACDDTHKYVITYGDGSDTDPAKVLNTDGHLSYDATNKKLVLASSTPSAKAGTYTIKVAATTSTDVSVDSGAQQTITMTLTDPCNAATADFGTINDLVYQLGG